MEELSDHLITFDEYVAKHCVTESKKDLAKRQYYKAVKSIHENELYQTYIITNQITASKVKDILLFNDLEVSKDILKAVKDEQEEKVSKLQNELDAFKNESIIAKPVKKIYTRDEILSTIEGLKALLDDADNKTNKKIMDTIEGLEVLIENDEETIEYNGYELIKANEIINEFID